MFAWTSGHLKPQPGVKIGLKPGLSIILSNLFINNNITCFIN